MSGRIIPRYPSTTERGAKTDPSPLGEPLLLPFSGVTVKNRFLKAPTSEHLATFHPTDLAARGIPTPELINLYSRWGAGGWGQIVTGNIMITPSDLEAPGNMIIPPSSDSDTDPRRFEAFAKLATATKSEGQGGVSLIIGQLNHPGRQAPSDLQSNPISASAIQLPKTQLGDFLSFATPRAATPADIAEVVDGFAHAALFLSRAGFSGAEIHAANGYLLAQFLSPRTNHRTDGYGGGLANRMRLLLEVVSEIKRRVAAENPSFVVGVKVTSVEFQDGGFAADEAVLLCQALEGAGVDYVQTSGGNYEDFGLSHKKESTRKRENYFVEFAERIAKAVGKTKVYTTGGLKTVGGMMSTFDGVDGLGFARTAIQEPSLPSDILAGRITGAMKPAVDDNNLGLQMMAYSYLFKQLGSGEDPVDLTDPEVIGKILSQFMSKE